MINETIRILLVEDDTVDQMSFKRSVKENDLTYDYTIAGSVHEASQILKTKKYDVIITDYNLGDGTAFDVLKLIKSTPIIFVTGKGNEETAVKAMKAGAHDYLIKDQDRNYLKVLPLTVDNAIKHNRAEKALKESEEMYRTLVKTSPDAVTVTNLEGHITFASQRTAEIHGFDHPDEIIGINALDLIAPEDRDRVRLNMEKVLKKGIVRNVEYTLLRKDGTRFAGELSAALIRDADGKSREFVGTTKDITERKESEKKLKDSEKNYRELVDNAIVGVFKTNAKGGILFANGAVLDICEFDSFEDLKAGGVLPRVKNPDDRNRLLNELKKKGEVREFEMEILTKHKQTKNILLNATLAEDIVSGMILDITHRKSIEEENKNIQAKLLQAQKMEAIGVLAGGIAHDFNNILMSIQGCSEIALVEMYASHPLYEELKQIQLSSDSAANLTRQLLLFSRRHPMELKPIDFNQTIQNLIKMLKRIIGEDVTIHIDLATDLWTIKADQGTLEQLIMNLSINARDAMPRGGKLTIRTANVMIDEAFCERIPQVGPGRYICFSITDTGIGMANEIVEHIFEPFFSTKAPGKGTGLGLSVVYGIVKQHGGGIQVCSEMGKGTEFNIYIPSIISEPEEKVSDETSLSELKGKGEKILLVEDEDYVRHFTKKALNKYGYEVSTAANADEAMSIFKEEMDELSMVLSDVVLPGKSGIELVDDLLIIKPALGVLFCSGYTDHKSQYPLIAKKGFRFLQKPFTLAHMLQNVRDAIGSHDMSS